MHDVELTIDALRTVIDAIARSAGDLRVDRRLAHVLELARLLRSDVVLSSAVRDLSSDRSSRDAARLDAIAQEVHRSAGHWFQQLSLQQQRVSPEADAWRLLVGSHESLVALASTGERLAVFLQRIEQGRRQAPGHTLEDVVAFADNSIPVLMDSIDGSNCATLLAPVKRMLWQLDEVATSARPLLTFQAVCGRTSIASITTRLESLLTEWERRLTEGSNGSDWRVPDDPGLDEDARTLAARVISFLGGKRTRRLVLHRAKVYFEHFFAVEARAAVAAEEDRVAAARQAGQNAQAQRELVLRRHLDRFIFQEGFFPITELDASRGNLDLLLADAEAAGVRPLVAEVKQAVRITPDNVTATEVSDAIGSATREIARYVGHLRSRPGWDAVEPIVVIFHTSVEDVSALEKEGTFLIDIGSRTPSRLRPAPQPQDATA